MNNASSTSLIEDLSRPNAENRLQMLLNTVTTPVSLLRNNTEGITVKKNTQILKQEYLEKENSDAHILAQYLAAQASEKIFNSENVKFATKHKYTEYNYNAAPSDKNDSLLSLSTMFEYNVSLDSIILPGKHKFSKKIEQQTDTYKIDDVESMEDKKMVGSLLLKNGKLKFDAVYLSTYKDATINIVENQLWANSKPSLIKHNRAYWKTSFTETRTVYLYNLDVATRKLSNKIHKVWVDEPKASTWTKKRIDSYILGLRWYDCSIDIGTTTIELTYLLLTAVQDAEWTAIHPDRVFEIDFVRLQGCWKPTLQRVQTNLQLLSQFNSEPPSSSSTSANTYVLPAADDDEVNILLISSLNDIISAVYATARKPIINGNLNVLPDAKPYCIKRFVPPTACSTPLVLYVEQHRNVVSTWGMSFTNTLNTMTTKNAYVLTGKLTIIWIILFVIICNCVSNTLAAEQLVYANCSAVSQNVKDMLTIVNGYDNKVRTSVITSIVWGYGMAQLGVFAIITFVMLLVASKRSSHVNNKYRRELGNARKKFFLKWYSEIYEKSYLPGGDNVGQPKAAWSITLSKIIERNTETTGINMNEHIQKILYGKAWYASVFGVFAIKIIIANICATLLLGVALGQTGTDWKTASIVISSIYTVLCIITVRSAWLSIHMIMPLVIQLETICPIIGWTLLEIKEVLNTQSRGYSYARMKQKNDNLEKILMHTVDSITKQLRGLIYHDTELLNVIRTEAASIMQGMFVAFVLYIVAVLTADGNNVILGVLLGLSWTLGLGTVEHTLKHISALYSLRKSHSLQLKDIIEQLSHVLIVHNADGALLYTVKQHRKAVKSTWNGIQYEIRLLAKPLPYFQLLYSQFIDKYIMFVHDLKDIKVENKSASHHGQNMSSTEEQDIDSNNVSHHGQNMSSTEEQDIDGNNVILSLLFEEGIWNAEYFKTTSV